MSTLFQASTLNALMLGNFDSTITVREFLRNADTGLGTYTGLDGEAIFEDGVAYKATADGTVIPMQPDDGVAFGAVTRMDPSAHLLQVKPFASLGELSAQLDQITSKNPNVFYMLRARGTFQSVHVRSCYPSQKPYPTLPEVASCQREFKYSNLCGSLIALYCPAYVKGINLPGWHFHFLSGDKTHGGHVLGISAKALTAHIQDMQNLKLILPGNPEFAGLDLCQDLHDKTAAVEGVK